MNFATLKSLTIPEGKVKNIRVGDQLLWQEQQSGGLNTDGLVFDYDLRNVTLEAHGTAYRVVDKTGTAMLSGSTAATGNDYGFLNYNFSKNALVANETENVRLGSQYTVQGLFRKQIAGDVGCVCGGMLSWLWEGWNNLNSCRIKPRYVNTNGAVTIVNTDYTAIIDTSADYEVLTYVVDEASLKIYFNTQLMHTVDANYSNFVRWRDYGGICVDNTRSIGGYVTAFVGYNRALTEAEIMNNLAYFKTLEVTA